MRGYDPFGSMQNMMSQFQGFMANPKQYMTDKMGIPQEYADNPNSAIQYLVSNGKISQQQYNQLQGIAGQIKNNPLFQQFMK